MGYSKCEHNAILCRYPAPSVDSPLEMEGLLSIDEIILCYVNLILFYCNPFFTAYKIITQTQDSSGQGLEGSKGIIRVSPPNLKISYFVNKKEKEIASKSNTYKLLITSNMWAINDQSPLSYSYKNLCNVF